MKKITVLMFAGLLTLAARAEDKPTNIVARVGATTITREELDAAVSAFTKQFTAQGRQFPADQLPRLQYDMVNEMVSRELLLHEAAGHEPADLEAETAKQIENVKLQLGGDEALDKMLAEMNVTRDEYKKRVRESVLIQAALKKIAEATPKVSDAATQKFYDDNQSKFVMPERVRASHILILVPPSATDEVKTQKMTQAKAALSLVKGGTKFEEVASKFSEDPGSAREGGDLDYFTRDRMVPEFATVAFELKAGDISDIVTTQFGYHIIKVTDHQAAGERPYAEVKADIAKYLENLEGRDAVTAHIKELRDKAKIEILIPAPQPEPVSVVTPPAKATPTVETKPVAAPTK